MGKESPEPSKPYQGPQFGYQDNVLSNYVLGNMYKNNPWAFTNANQGQGQTLQGGGNIGGQPYAPSFNPVSFGAQGLMPAARANQPISQGDNSITPINYRSKFGPMTGTGHVNSQNGFSQNLINPVPLTTNTTNRYTPYQFTNPNVNFTQRSPYQFNQAPGINVADTYRPQYDMAKRDILEQGQMSREQLLSDMNKRGLLTTGATTRMMDLQMKEQDRKLANLSSQYAIEQGRAQLQEDQMRRQMEAQRQLSQAEEIFRQQGASDEQAKYLAAQNINLQNLQAGQNLSGFQTNLGAQQQQYGQGLSNANLMLNARQQQLAQQGQNFNQGLESRRVGIAEQQLANLLQRQPIEDLFRLWQQQAGMTGATQGSPGLMGVLGPIAGAVAGSLIPGVGTAVGAGIGSAASGMLGGLR